MPSSRPTIVLAGATGNLGGRIARSLLDRGARVRAIVRHDGAPDAIAALGRAGAEIVRADYAVPASLARACEGGSCVVSALAGLRDVIVLAQSALLDAAIDAGVPRFIPSDFCIDYAPLPEGANRNLDFRRELRDRLEGTAIAATSVLNGMFTDLLAGPAPLVLFRFRRVLYWHDADQPLDFTTVDDTAAYTAAAALDDATPRWLRIAGDEISARELALAASEATGERFRLTRAGGLGRLEGLIRVTRAVVPGKDELYPPWQGMQYLHDMFEGRAKLAPLDNDRYPDLRWTSVREVLAAHVAEAGALV